ncbi:universal stress protein, partial [Micromonospora chalcea]|uniref:universal stress protein n=1 Tax=Micromonospora chalcea TaxID=1874 RepID=UPI0033FA4F25
MNEEILVGYDGSPDAAVALNWALDEAGRSGWPVRLAYVFEWLTVTGWIGPGVAPGVWPDEAARRQVEELVRKAAGPDPISFSRLRAHPPEPPATKER